MTGWRTDREDGVRSAEQGGWPTDREDGVRSAEQGEHEASPFSSRFIMSIFTSKVIAWRFLALPLASPFIFRFTPDIIDGVMH